MDVRSATAADGSAIERIARASFQSSYALSPGDIDSLIENYFADDAFADRLDDEDAPSVVVAADDDGVVGFAEVHPDGWLEWLHVEPTERGQGAGTALVEHVRDEVLDGERFEAHVLEDASEGSAFLERFGLSASGTTDLDFGTDESYAQEIYTTTSKSLDSNEPNVDVPESLEADDQSMRVAGDDPIPGTEAPFFEVRDGDDEAWGYFCSQCGSTDVVADGLDRLECDECGNEHRADQWDDAYL
ncbi:GNAT family N-acetyltransferase [Halorubellus sp. JP-L1]|uniref:GNAT family N-acetyltransferase n=1 Tax=Halorubellus sp. JP-L1 TaxID=2715753 RepID=UPI00140A93E3|nr:GNAT family N-acetyltransferase [Halorubellus sp. JP-L1]NHN42733.1 GNAT family N-acetyltransferase [Halorubellus sp. JP-L1]